MTGGEAKFSKQSKKVFLTMLRVVNGKFYITFKMIKVLWIRVLISGQWLQCRMECFGDCYIEDNIFVMKMRIFIGTFLNPSPSSMEVQAIPKQIRRKTWGSKGSFNNLISNGKII